MASACGSGGKDAGVPAASPTTVSAPTSGPAPTSDSAAPSTTPTTMPGAAAVPEALRFTAASIDGARVVGADYAGKDVALWFWAPW